MPHMQRNTNARRQHKWIMGSLNSLRERAFFFQNIIPHSIKDKTVQSGYPSFEQKGLNHRVWKTTETIKEHKSSHKVIKLKENIRVFFHIISGFENMLWLDRKGYGEKKIT